MPCSAETPFAQCCRTSCDDGRPHVAAVVVDERHDILVLAALASYRRAELIVHRVAQVAVYQLQRPSGTVWRAHRERLAVRLCLDHCLGRPAPQAITQQFPPASTMRAALESPLRTASVAALLAGDAWQRWSSCPLFTRRIGHTRPFCRGSRLSLPPHSIARSLAHSFTSG